MERAGKTKDFSMADDDVQVVCELSLEMKRQREACQSGKVFASGGYL
jgi:hypothetical protein